MWERVIYLRGKGRKPIRLTPYKAGVDLQNQVPFGWCSICGREVYDGKKYICEECERGRLYGKARENGAAASLPYMLSGGRSGRM